MTASAVAAVPRGRARLAGTPVRRGVAQSAGFSFASELRARRLCAEHAETRHIGMAERRQIEILAVDRDLCAVGIAEAYRQRAIAGIRALRTGRQQTIFKLAAIGADDLDPARAAQLQRQR